MLPLFGEANIVGIVLDEDDQVKVKYLIAARATSRMSGKLTYLNWLQFLDEGDDGRSATWWRHPCILPFC